LAAVRIRWLPAKRLITFEKCTNLRRPACAGGK
jgi:hypothetical protein